MNDEIRFTLNGENAALGQSTCSAGYYPSTQSLNVGNTATAASNTNMLAPAECVDASTDAHIRRIVGEELAKSEERIAEMVVRKITDQVRSQAGARR